MIISFLLGLPALLAAFLSVSLSVSVSLSMVMPAATMINPAANILYFSLQFSEQSTRPFAAPDFGPLIRDDEQNASRSRRRGKAQEDKAGDGEEDKVLSEYDMLGRRYHQCLDQAVQNPAIAVETANRWIGDKGGYLAHACLGFSFAQGLAWRSAHLEFVKAAKAASETNPPFASRAWAKAGNAALAQGEAGIAIGYFEQALGAASLTPFYEGEIELDRARALVQIGRVKEARLALDRTIILVPDDPLAWLLSATLARRDGNLTLADEHIAQALLRVKNDPAIWLEQGNIAYASGDDERAARWWGKAAQSDDITISIAAKSGLEALGIDDKPISIEQTAPGLEQ